MDRIAKELKAAQRIVVKVGTSTLTYPDTGKMNLQRMDRLALVLSDLHNQGKEIVLVSSGAIGIAMGKLGMSEKPKEIQKKQAIAAVGQCELMYLYDKLFSGYNNTVAQILLTKEDIAIPRRKRHTQNTFNALLEMGIIPIVNENDTISVDEIEIGDNDNLSAIVADILDADLLVLFSDIDGLYDDDPRKNPDAKMIDVVSDIESVKNLAGGAGTKCGTGGMVTKIEAAQRATSVGINMVIANGENIDALYDLVNGKLIGTLFVAADLRGIENE